MKKIDRELLLKDLCARLHFGVYVNYKNVENKEGIIMLNPYNIQHIYSGWWKKYKPYLRSMSSMTEEESKEFLDYIGLDPGTDSIEDGYIHIIEVSIIYFDLPYKAIDWLNKNMFDYRGLIPKNMAIEITEENNPYKN